jgi:hypothetical protein
MSATEAPAMFKSKLGPYRSGEEQRFKQDAIKDWESQGRVWSYFCIESPGTADGFPDVLALTGGPWSEYALYEFKVSDDSGVIHFQKTQPLFYRKHSDLHIWIVAWDVPRNAAEIIDAKRVVEAKSLRFKLRQR